MNPGPENRELDSRVHYFLENTEIHFEKSIGEFLGLPGPAWMKPDFEISRKTYRTDQESRLRFDHSLASLTNTFLGWLHREKGMTYLRANLVSTELTLFIFDRIEGPLKKTDYLEQFPFKNNLSVQILVPDYQNLDTYLSDAFSIFNIKSFAAFAFLEGVPYWLEFLVQNDLLDLKSQRLIFNALSELFQETKRYWNMRDAIQDFDFPALEQAWS